jgi:hypothetical protein
LESSCATHVQRSAWAIPTPLQAHRDIRITSQEGELLRRELLDVLGRKGLTEADVRGVFSRLHNVIEMRTRRFL